MKVRNYLARMLALVLMSAAVPAVAETGEPWPASLLAGELAPVYHPLQVARSLTSPVAELEGEPGTSRGTLRDPQTVAVYERVAPTVVLVTDGENGHGTGFFVQPDGWIITNHHVVDELPFDRSRGTQLARIVYGHVADDGAMQAESGYLEADVYRTDEVRDLALLKLRSLPDGMTEVPYLELAEHAPAPGTTCVAIGHPSMGVMWTLRSGEVSGRGYFPQDQIADHFFPAADRTVAKEAAQMVEKEPRRLVLLSTCGLNPGDSGGPLVDIEGRLIAVSFAVPPIDEDRGLDLGKFSFHVHLDEVRTFLDRTPTEPEALPPSPLPGANYQRLADMDGDGVDDAWVFTDDKQGPPVGMLIDLDQDSEAAQRRPSVNKLSTLNPENEWDFEFAVTLGDAMTCFYDLNNDRQVDLVVVGARDGAPAVRYELHDGQWQQSEHRGSPLLDDVFADRSLNRRLAQVAKLLHNK